MSTQYIQYLESCAAEFANGGVPTSPPQVRIIFRLIEFGPGLNADNPLLANEAYPLGLDAVPMLLALTLLNLMHPGFVLRGPDSEFPRLSRAEKKAIKIQKKAAKRQRKTADTDGDVLTDDVGVIGLTSLNARPISGHRSTRERDAIA